MFDFLLGVATGAAVAYFFPSALSFAVDKIKAFFAAKP